SPVAEIWDKDKLADPHAVADKQRRVRDMFAAIAPSYDRNNHVHSMWTDQAWRRKAVKLSRLKPDDVVVDVACGTGDLTLAYRRELLKLGGRGKAVGVDYTYEMLPIAADKSTPPIPYLNGDAQALPLPDACCDVVSIAFGIRNVADPDQALREFRRVLRPGGRVVVLEFSKPTNVFIRRAYDFYFNQIMTRTATLISGDKTGAYRYLSASVETFMTPQQMQEKIAAAGFERVVPHKLTFGIAYIYVGEISS
ncbi:MAG: bifunctional demethylmenaquinone methyltransferase/2-methoxy-6-polyprenyl-1,4-benzoquinol methylase UbiE, partial [Planctomycetota bacterium]